MISGAHVVRVRVADVSYLPLSCFPYVYSLPSDERYIFDGKSRQSQDFEQRVQHVGRKVLLLRTKIRQGGGRDWNRDTLALEKLTEPVPRRYVVGGSRMFTRVLYQLSDLLCGDPSFELPQHPPDARSVNIGRPFAQAQVFEHEVLEVDEIVIFWFRHFLSLGCMLIVIWPLFKMFVSLEIGPNVTYTYRYNGILSKEGAQIC